MKKNIILVFLLTLLYSCNINQTAKTKIGVDLPLTGGAAIYGDAIKKGIELAYSESNLKKSIEIVYEDNKGEAKSAVSAMYKLLDENCKVVIGGAMSSNASAIVPISSGQEIPLISPGASTPSLDSASLYFLRLWPSDTYDGKIMAKFIVKELGIKKVGIFYVHLEYGVGIKNVFNQEVKKYGGQILFSDSYDQGSTDFRTQIEKIKKSGIEALFLPGYTQELSILLNQINVIGLKVKLFGTSSFHDSKLLDLTGDVLKGAYFSYPVLDLDTTNVTINEFIKNYYNKYHKQPDIWAALGFDCFKLIDRTLKEGAKSSIEINKKLHNIKNYSGVSGIISFDKFGNVQKKLAIFKINHEKKIIFLKKNE